MVPLFLYKLLLHCLRAEYANNYRAFTHKILFAFYYLMEVKQIITTAFKSGKLERKTQNEIISALRLSPSYKKPIITALKSLSARGDIIKLHDGRYVTPEKAGAFQATVKAHPNGFAFLIPDGYAERENDFFVPAKHLRGALNGDKVLAVPVNRGGDEATVVKILSRGKTIVTGRLEKDGGRYFVFPDDRAYNALVLIPSTHLSGAVEGDKVVARLTNDKDRPCGKIVAILGKDGDMLTEEEAIIISAKLKTEFPERVEEAADEVAKAPIILGGRRDLRELLTITIDGDDTRDIDDAISLDVVDGKTRLGVHIADVSNYVKPNDIIDREAYERGTSVYFPDRVLPMLPKALSNGACSLNENEDKFAMTCFMYFDDNGKKLSYELCESVIRSDRRMTYNEVTDILNRGEQADESHPEIAPMLRQMAELTLKLEALRRKAGEVSLDVKEAHIYVNERGEIVIPYYERALSHRMIEQFMVSANESVASFALKAKVPFLYRVHERPSSEKVSLLYGFVSDLGITAKGNTEEAKPKDFQKILNAAKDKPYASVVSKIMLRSMQKARYCEENLGHFGLASGCYCHFTSPIRRYPDLFVHRILKILLQGGDAESTERFKSFAKAAAIATSERENVADKVERDVDDLYKVAYMEKHIGEEFDAVISGVTDYGIFAELANTVEGLIRFEHLPDDRYEFYPEKFLLKGKRHSYRLGDNVKIKVAGCDLGSRRIQFALV